MLVLALYYLMERHFMDILSPSMCLLIYPDKRSLFRFLSICCRSLLSMGVARRKVSLMDTGKTFGKGLSQQLNIIVKDYWQVFSFESLLYSILS